MSRTPCVLVVRIVVELILSQVVQVSHESHIIGDVLLLGEVLDVHTKVNDDLLELDGVSEGHKEAAGDLIDHTSWQLQLLLYLDVRVVPLGVGQFLAEEILVLEDLMTKEGVMDFGLFSLFVNGDPHLA